jgi:hypothetical protein
VNPVILLAIALLMMPVTGYFVIAGWRGGSRLAEARRKAPPPEPVERLEADLRRLRAELEDTETRAGLTAKQHRVRALRGAYLDVLSTACRRLDVPPPEGGEHATLAEIYRAESAVLSRGVRTNPPDPRAR